MKSNNDLTQSSTKLLRRFEARKSIAAVVDKAAERVWARAGG